MPEMQDYEVSRTDFISFLFKFAKSTYFNLGDDKLEKSFFWLRFGVCLTI